MGSEQRDTRPSIKRTSGRLFLGKCVFFFFDSLADGASSLLVVNGPRAVSLADILKCSRRRLHQPDFLNYFIFSQTDVIN